MNGAGEVEGLGGLQGLYGAGASASDGRWQMADGKEAELAEAPSWGLTKAVAAGAGEQTW